MKILHYSDFSDPNIQTLYSQCDLLITTGDLESTAFSGIDHLIPKKPGFGVYGNHDVGSNYIENMGLKNLHLKVAQYNGLSWGGFEGCPRYKNGEHMFDEEDAKNFADTFGYVDILLLHAGPLGLLDDPIDDVHKGSPSIRRYVEEKQPKYIFCGHQYSNAEMVFNNTKIFRTFGARIIEINL